MNTTITSFDARDLRRAFGSFGTGVTVVTARSNDERLAGLTVNSFSSVSLAPPIVAWSLATQSASLELFKEAGRFVINVLTVDQLRLARQFSNPLADKFANVDYQAGLADQPVLEDCAATLECRIVGTHLVGDHCMFLGQVERYSHCARRPLLFCQGAFQQGIELVEAPQQNLLDQRRTA